MAGQPPLKRPIAGSIPARGTKAAGRRHGATRLARATAVWLAAGEGNDHQHDERDEREDTEDREEDAEHAP